MLVGVALGLALVVAICAIGARWGRARLRAARDEVDSAAARAERAERFAAAVPVFLLTQDGEIQDANDGARDLLAETGDAAATSFVGLAHADDRARLATLFDRGGDDGTGDRIEVVRLRTRDGSWRVWEVCRIDARSGGESEATAGAALVRVRNVDDREELRAELAAQRLIDPLTGLPTRNLFVDRLGHALSLAARRGEMLGVVILDHGFPGSLAGSKEARDRLTVAVTRRVQLALRHGDTVALWEDGRITVLLEALHDVLDAAAVIERVLDRFMTPVTLGDAPVLLSPRIGIALSGGHERPDDLMLQAEAALINVRQGNLATYAVFDPSMTSEAVGEIGLEAELRQALGVGEVRLLFEPIVRLDDGRVGAYEARPVWQHPRRGVVAALELVAIAEAVGMIVSLQQWVLISVCRVLQDWQAAQADEAPLLCLDVPTQPFRHPNLAGDVARAIHEAGAHPRRLRLEIDQAQALGDIDATVARLEALKEVGVGVAIDGFGTGYAALGFLQRCPVDCLKIRSSYVAGLGVDPDDSAIAQAALAFARGLDIPVVAVGVETAAQRDELRRLGCTFAQGPLFGPLLTPDQLRLQDRPTVQAGSTQTGDRKQATAAEVSGAIGDA